MALTVLLALVTERNPKQANTETPVARLLEP
jgi:hypothetical protein